MEKEAGKPSPEHERGVAAAEKWIEKSGYEVGPLEMIGGCRPDAYGEKSLPNNKVAKIIIEVETAESFTDQHAKKQMEAFADWASEYKSRGAVLFIPKGSKNAAREALPKYTDYQEF